MTDNMPTAHQVEIPRSLWIGRMDFDLLNGRGWRIATIEIVVRIGSLTLWCDRTVAVIDREQGA